MRGALDQHLVGRERVDDVRRELELLGPGRQGLRGRRGELGLLLGRGLRRRSGPPAPTVRTTTAPSGTPSATRW
ncbi:hypothetical protein [Georgenia sp. SUBG003]|uniref:hypothetical protein n=1 Tax=Georgenia sp. SUBG003 TaxID=1497974 RepID=UPI003AB751ED